MKYSEVLKYLVNFPGAVKAPLNDTGTAFGFKVGETIFAYFETGAPIQWKLTLRVNEQQFQQLHYPPQILQARDKPPGYWLTIVRLENFDEPLLKELIEGSYTLARDASSTLAASQ